MRRAVGVGHHHPRSIRVPRNIDFAIYELALAAGDFNFMMLKEQNKQDSAPPQTLVEIKPQVADDFIETADKCLDLVKKLKGPKRETAYTKAIWAARVACAAEFARRQIHDCPRMGVARAQTLAAESRAADVVIEAVLSLGRRQKVDLAGELAEKELALEGGLIRPIVQNILAEERNGTSSAPFIPDKKTYLRYASFDFGSGVAQH